MQGIERKPEPRSCSGKEHQCVVGLSLPSYFDCRKRVNYAQVSAARDHLQGGLSLVSAAPRLVSARFSDNSPNSTEAFPCSRYANCMDFSRRRLPHFYPPGRWLFLTWHLHGSLPHGRYPLPESIRREGLYLDGSPFGLRLDRAVLPAPAGRCSHRRRLSVPRCCPWALRSRRVCRNGESCAHAA